MSGYNPDYDADGDWEDRGDLAWNEYDWQRYLKQHDQELERFLAHYRKLTDNPNRLDNIALMMGWDREDWNAGDIQIPADENTLPSEETTAEAPLETDDIEPYTVHRHPVFVVTRALTRALHQSWSHLVKSHDTYALDNTLVLDFANSLHQTKFQAIMAIQALDMGDFTLCVTHFKNALAELNRAMGLLQNLPIKQDRACALFYAEALPMLFDLRELWLRVMSECREEHRRGLFGD